MPAEDDRRRRTRAWALLATGGTVAALSCVGGAVWGGLVAAVTLLAAAWAVWPVVPSAAGLTHRELDAAWHAARPVYEALAAWSLWVAWADAQGESVELSLIERAPVSGPVVRGAPSRYVRHTVQRVDGEDAEAAAEAMEVLRAQAAEREEAGRQAHSQALSDADRAAHEAALAAIDQRTHEYAAEQEAQMQAELAADRAAQAQAVARALRRP